MIHRSRARSKRFPWREQLSAPHSVRGSSIIRCSVLVIQ